MHEKIRTSTRRRAMLWMSPVGLGLAIALFLAPAFACSGGPAVGIMGPASGAPGTMVTMTGNAFASGAPLDVRWNAPDGPVLASTTVDSQASFRTEPFAIPSVSWSGDYLLLAVSGSTRIPFVYHVDLPPPAPGAPVQYANSDAPMPVIPSELASTAVVPAPAAPNAPMPVIPSEGANNATAGNNGGGTPAPTSTQNPAQQSTVAEPGSVGSAPQSPVSPAAAAQTGSFAPGGGSPVALVAGGGGVTAVGAPALSAPIDVTTGRPIIEAPAANTATSAKVAQGVQPSLSFGSNSGAGADSARAAGSVAMSTPSMFAMVVAFGFALTVGGLFATGTVRRRKARVAVAGASPEAAGDSLS